MHSHVQLDIFPQGKDSCIVLKHHRLICEAADLPPVRNPLPIVRKRFIRYHKRRIGKEKEFSKIGDDSIQVIKEGKRWWWVMKEYSNKWDELDRVKSISPFGMEILEGIWGMERMGLMKYLDGKGIREKRREDIIKAIGIDCENDVSERKELLRVETIGRRNVRSFILNRHSLIFRLELCEEGISPSFLFESFATQIRHFNEGIHTIGNERMNKRRRRLFQISLYHELTETAYHSIQVYLETLKNSGAFILVEANVEEEGIKIESEHALNVLKSPIMACARMNDVHVNIEDQERWINDVNKIVKEGADISSFIKHPRISPFSLIIYKIPLIDSMDIDEELELLVKLKELILKLRKAPERLDSGIFVVETISLWNGLRKVAKGMVDRIEKDVKSRLNERLDSLLTQFRKYDRLLFFRSINPQAMLHNKAIVDGIVKNEIDASVNLLVQVCELLFTLSQHIQLDSMQQETLLSIVSFRLTLPQQLEEHRLFFEKRMSSFLSFVQKTQSRIAAGGTKLLDKASITTQFVNPHESESYLDQLKSIKPVVSSLCTELDALNEFEVVVNLPLTEIPRVRSLKTDVNLMEDLFESTINYYSHVNEFFDLRRTHVSINESESIVSRVVNQLNECEKKAGQHRSLRHFILQVRNDVDKFKKNFPVLEVMSCKKFVERHWVKISEIVGVDMSVHSNSKVNVICELGLEEHLNQLRPISFAAERESQLAENIDNLISFWLKATFEWTSHQIFHLRIPSNLPFLKEKAQTHVEYLRQLSKGEMAITRETINEWSSKMEVLLSRLSKWECTLSLWTTLSFALQTNKLELKTEYEHFRRVAKYWKRMEKSLNEHSLVILILDMSHSGCWIESSSRHLNSILSTLSTLIQEIRVSCPRLSLTPSHYILKMLSTNDIQQILSLLLSNCFPLLSSLEVKEDESIELTTRDGESILINDITSTLKDRSLVEFVQLLEKSISDSIMNELSIDRRDFQPGKTAKKLNEMIISTSSALVILKTEFGIMGCLRGSTKRTRITIDIGVASTLPSPSVSLISPWSNGNILLLIGSLHSTRQISRSLSSCLFTSPFFISSNPSIDGKLISLLLRSSRRESIVFVIENVNLLREESWDDLLRESSSETNYPRIVLTSTVQMRVNQSIHSEKIRERTMTKTPKSREGLVTSHRLSISSSPIEGATAVVGLSSKRYLQSKLVSRSCEWIYLDGLESDQLLKECEQLSGEPKGIVSSLVSRNLPQLIYSVPSTSCTRGPTPELSCSHFIILYSYSRDLSFFSSFLTLLTSQERIMDEIEGNPREESPLLSSLPPPYISLSDGSSMYSIRSSSFILCAPNLEEDLRPLGITSIQVKEKSLRGAMDSYRLEWKDKLRDILPRDHTQLPFLSIELCLTQILLPLIIDTNTEEYLDHMMSLLLFEISDLSIHLSSCASSVSRFTVISLIINYLSIVIDHPQFIDSLLIKMNIEQELTVGLPENISSYKMSATEMGRWIRWEDEPFTLSLLDKHLPLTDIIIVNPPMDRLISYSIRAFSSNKNVMVCGPPLSGKTTLVKRLERMVMSMGDCSFEWISMEDRANIQSAQLFLSKFIGRNDANPVYLVLDGIKEEEPMISLLEMLIEERKVVIDNQLETVQINLKVILIGDLYLESRLNFSSHFIYVRVKQVERDEMERMVEQLITWHIHSKAFSSEYLSMAQRLATAVVTISLQHYVFIPPLSIILRLTKSLFFSSPDNSPDIHSIIRLFTHESIRIIGDSLPEELHSTVYQDLINIIQTILNCNANSLFENHLMMEEGEESTLNLSRLLYSEIETHDTIEGIPYIPVLDFTHLLRAAQNSVFESNSVGIQMNLTMTKWSCLQWQKCSRVLRQSNEHLILAGLPRSGRYQCFRLSAFSTCVQIDHIWSSSPLEWTQSFLASITRILPLLTSSNHHIALLFHADFTPLPSSFLSYLLLFMESPSTNRFLSDELLLSMGESILEEEKSLSVQMQSTSIRLPGERLSKFVSGDSLKDVSVLRSILHSRMHQFIHFVFLVPPIDLHPFHFGTINLFQSPQLIDITRMKESLLPPSSSHSFIDHLSSLQSIAYQLISQTRFRPVEIEFADQKETYELFSSFSKEYSTKRQDLKQREEMIEKSMRIIEDLQRIGKVEMSRNREELVAVLSDEEVKRLEIEKRKNEITTKMEIMMNELTNLQSKYKKDEEQLISIENLMEKTLMIPRDNYAKCVSDVVQFPLSEWKKMISVPKPSVGIRFVIKSIDLLLYGDHSDNIQFGKESSKSLKWERTRMSISSLHVESIPHSRIVQLKKYVGNRELKPTRLESDSKLASTLSIWISSVYSYSQIYYSLRDKAKTLFELKEKRELREEETGKMKETMNELLLEEKNLVVVEKELASTISTNKRAFDFMRRSEEIGEAVKKLIPRWKDSLKKTKKNASRLLGDSLIISSFSSLLAHSNHPLRKESLKEWHEYLNGEGIDSSPFSITPSSLLTRTLLSLPTKRRFPLLLFSSHLQPLPILRYIYTHSITIDCSNIDWKSKNTFDRIHKLLYSSLPIIFHSLHSSPPSEYFPLLFPSDGEISYFGRSIELPQDLFLLFVTNSLDGFSKEFIHLLDVLVIDEEPLLEDMDNQMKESDSLDQVTKYIFDLSAEDLLESSEKCDKLVSLANTITFE